MGMAQLQAFPTLPAKNVSAAPPPPLLRPSYPPTASHRCFYTLRYTAQIVMSSTVSEVVTDYIDYLASLAMCAVFCHRVWENLDHLKDISSDSSIQTGCIVMAIYFFGSSLLVHLNKLIRATERVRYSLEALGSEE